MLSHGRTAATKSMLQAVRLPAVKTDVLGMTVPRCNGNPLKGAPGPSPRRGVPQKRVNKVDKDFFMIFFEFFRGPNLRFLAFSGGPEGFREVREAGRNHFHLS